MSLIKIFCIFVLAFGGFTWSLPSLAYSSTTNYLTTKNMSKGLNGYKHGLSYTKSYKAWQSIKERCYTKHHKSYDSYGGRGIKLADYWIVDVVNFCDYITQLPDYDKPGYSLDRINNNGDYEEGNLRWASRRTQSLNRRTKNTSNHHNIYPNDNNWTVRFWMNKGKVNLGTYKTISQAIIVRNSYLKTLKT